MGDQILGKCQLGDAAMQYTRIQHGAALYHLLVLDE